MPGVRSTIVILNTVDGSVDKVKVIDSAENNGIGTSNDIEVAMDGNTVTGFVTTGLDFSHGFLLLKKGMVNKLFRSSVAVIGHKSC